VDPRDTLLRIDFAFANAQRIAFIWVLPGLVLLTATIILIRRKRK
jgi:ABC-2 type transport system permease protein